MASWDATRTKATTCQSTRELIPQDTFAFYGHQMLMTETDMPQSLKSKFGKTSERVATEWRERSAEQLFADLESVASAVEGSDLGLTEDPFEPTSSCFYDTKKRQLVTRSGLPRLRCCEYHLHHKPAMNSLALQQVYHFKVHVIAGDANAAAFK